VKKEVRFFRKARKRKEKKGGLNEYGWSPGGRGGKKKKKNSDRPSPFTSSSASPSWKGRREKKKKKVEM